MLLRMLTRNFGKKTYYAVACGHEVGIFDTWDKCQKSVKGFKNARYKKFPTLPLAEEFIKENSTTASSETFTNKSYKPQVSALLLGKKGAITWPTDEEALVAKKPKLHEKLQVLEYWPESDGDTYEADGISDEDLLTAMLEVEGYVHNSTTTAVPQQSTSRGIKQHVSKIWEPAGIKRVGSYDFLIDEEGFVIVYTDGSCLNNGRINACAGLGVYFNDDHPLNAGKPVNGRLTNNVGEIQAAIYAIKTAQDIGIQKLCISTDSQFLINAATQWINVWKRKQWRLKNGDPVKNLVDFQELDRLLQDKSLKVKWNYVKAHKGIKGNEMADKLAREGASMYKHRNAHIDH